MQICNHLCGAMILLLTLLIHTFNIKSKQLMISNRVPVFTFHNIHTWSKSILTSMRLYYTFDFVIFLRLSAKLFIISVMGWGELGGIGILYEVAAAAACSRLAGLAFSFVDYADKITAQHLNVPRPMILCIARICFCLPSNM